MKGRQISLALLVCLLTGSPLLGDLRKKCQDNAAAAYTSCVNKAWAEYDGTDQNGNPMQGYNCLGVATNHYNDCIDPFSTSNTGLAGCYRAALTKCGNDNSCYSTELAKCDADFLGPNGVCPAVRTSSNNACAEVFGNDKNKCVATQADAQGLCPTQSGTCSVNGDCFAGYDLGTACNPNTHLCENCPSGQYCLVGSFSLCRDKVTCPCGDVPQCKETTYGTGWVCNSSCTPIVLDPFEQGFHLTSIANGVKFRVKPGGPLFQMGWTDANWRNGWLALDRNGNGTIDDFTELFGNMTPQPPSSNPNGFLALSVFDAPKNGGNGNGVIDPDDAVYPRLRVWIDANHNGVSESGELHTLQELGIFKIGLEYKDIPLVDKYGNVFRYKGSVWDDGAKQKDVCYDVILQVQPN